MKFPVAIIIIGVLFAPFSFAQVDQIERKEGLKKQLGELQVEIGNYREEIREKRKEEKTLGREIGILNSQIRKTELELEQTALAIRRTELAIYSNSDKIAEFEKKINRSKDIIAEIMRSINEEDSRGILEIIVLAGDLSDFFDYSRFLENLQSSLQLALDNVKTAKANIEKEQEALEEEQDSQERLRALQGIQREGLSGRKSEKGRLLDATLGQKAEFERIVSQKERDIEQIRNQIFLLEGVGISLPLHKAYELAKFASDRTGVRPAFLLAVLKQESKWGKNVGQCYLDDIETGAGRGKNTGNIYPRTMKPTRDVAPFLQITQELGRDPFNTLVSCPHPNYGYGGAMGPAQFLPSTWMGYRDRAAALLGHTPDPWDLQDSFTTSAIKLANGGANVQTYDAEWKASMIYYAGSRWNNPLYSFYGDSVMDIARVIQEEINAMIGA